MPELYVLSWLVPVLPALAALWIGVTSLAGINKGEKGESQTALVATIGSGGALAFLLLLGLFSLFNGVPGQVQMGNWFHSGALKFSISLLLDSYALLVATLSALISFLCIRFSVNYMHRETGFQRFFMLMSLFTSAMLLILLSGNLLLTFIGWELAGVSSYLLIGYAYDRTTATENANWAFVTNRIGDAGFILGIFLSFSWLNTQEWTQIQSGAESLSPLYATLIAGSFLVAALAKSAQIPFAGWIGRALEGPTPSSAVFYGSLMVHAGVYLLIRLQPVLEQTPALMVGLTVLGVVSVLYGWLGALVQTDIKSSFMFSTTAQVGLMFTACGLGWFELAGLHLLLHAAWRAYQFLHAPSLIYMVDRPQRRVPVWLANKGWIYNAALRRFWLDQVSNAVLIKPTNSLARDLQNFDERVVNRLVGLPSRCNAISGMGDCGTGSRVTPEGSINEVRGVAGRLMESLAGGLQWFENHLILKGGGEGLVHAIQLLGKYMEQAEYLLSQPRYLVLLIAATFVVII